MRVVEPPGGVSVLVIAAHPDDTESWCAGTLARSVDAGATVRLVVVTSGEKGTSDPTAHPATVGCQREQEARVAAQQLGVAEVKFLRYPDGEVENTPALRNDLVRWIRCWHPAVLFTHDPEHGVPAYLNHPDHRATGRAALDAVYPFARDPLSFPGQLAEGLVPHAVSTIWLFASAAADVCTDIEASFERKLTARLAHVSQTKDPMALRASWRERAATTGAAAGVALAEAFTVLCHD